MPISIAELDALRDRLTRTLDAVDDMAKILAEERSGIAPDGYGLVGDDVVVGAALSEAVECSDHFEPVEVQAIAIVERFWVVKVPVADANGDIEGEEIMRFPTKEEADAYVKSAEAEP